MDFFRTFLFSCSRVIRLNSSLAILSFCEPCHFVSLCSLFLPCWTRMETRFPKMAGNRDYGLFKVICKLHVCLPFVTHLLQSPSTAVGFQTVYWCQGISCNIHVQCIWYKNNWYEKIIKLSARVQQSIVIIKLLCNFHYMIDIIIIHMFVSAWPEQQWPSIPSSHTMHDQTSHPK